MTRQQTTCSEVSSVWVLLFRMHKSIGLLISTAAIMQSFTVRPSVCVQPQSKRLRLWQNKTRILNLQTTAHLSFYKPLTRRKGSEIISNSFYVYDPVSRMTLWIQKFCIITNHKLTQSLANCLYRAPSMTEAHITCSSWTATW